MTPRSLSSQLLGLFVCLLVTFAAAGLGAVASIHAAAFYAELIKPSWAPPAGVFGPVWSVLYSMMAIAAWLVWRSGGETRGALVLFAAQLIANALWSWLFFAWHRGALAAIEVLILWLLIALTIGAFWRVNRFAVTLLIPYLLWVSFASLLTWSVWQRNPGLL